MNTFNRRIINHNSLVNQVPENNPIDASKYTDPKYIGPGIWIIIHQKAFRADTKNKQYEFIKFMKEDIGEYFPCDKCREHCIEYINNHPMEEYIDTIVEINGKKLSLGMFVWAWQFHNSVNVRTNKPVINWDTIYNLYSDKDSLVCSKNCFESGDVVSNNNVVNYNSRNVRDNEIYSTRNNRSVTNSKQSVLNYNTGKYDMNGTRKLLSNLRF